ncbi:response regulator transcription factor [Leucobacter chromiireducens]|uniref:response regulator transcription factor n=1 Tax=Leucobacter chromiireducens TaxID=283877 RepID=UPI003075C537
MSFPAPAAAPAPLRVLVVDDDPWTTRAVVHALAGDPGLSPLVPVHSGEAAVAAYEEHRPDVVLMDLSMPPGMSGVEATALIRRVNPDACVVVLTTVSPGPGVARALEAGAICALQKTAPPDTLCAAVKLAAEGGAPTLLKRLASDISIAGDTLPDAPIVAPVLTPSEYAILLLVCEGRSYEEIAESQGITVWTAKSHVKRLREKLAAENLAQLVVRALQFRFIGG